MENKDEERRPHKKMRTRKEVGVEESGDGAQHGESSDKVDGGERDSSVHGEL